MSDLATLIHGREALDRRIVRSIRDKRDGRTVITLDPKKPLPVPTAEDVQRRRADTARGRILADIVNIDPDELYPNVFYSWATECWNCGTESWVAFENIMFGISITPGCMRQDVRGDMSQYISGTTPLALIGTVTTKAGGSYLGYRCHECQSVLGKHFLGRDLIDMLADRAPHLRTNYFPDTDQG